MSHKIRPVVVIAIAGLALVAAGCASITGLDGKSTYSCKAPDGVQCDSVSGNYYNSVQNNLPSQRSAPTSGGSTEAPASAPTRQEVARTTATSARTAEPAGHVPYNAAPLRVAPRVVRLWIKPWEDADRDLNGEAVVYVQVDSGRWSIDHVQRQARESFAPVRPGKQPSAAAAKAGAPAPTDDGTSVTQALRALQQRSADQTGN